MKKYLLYIIPLILNIPLSMMLTSCHDDPEPIVEPDDPEPYDPRPKYWNSWFDKDEKDRWPITWTREGEDEIFGPGEYEFTIPESGGEYGFFYPNSPRQILHILSDNIFARRANDAGIPSLIYSKLIFGFRLELISTLDPENKTFKIIVDKNMTTDNRSISIWTYPGATNNSVYTLVKYTANQLPGDENVKCQSNRVQWKSYGNIFKLDYNRDLSHVSQTLCNSSGDQFKLRCLNYGDLSVTSVSLDGNAIEITDNKHVASQDINVQVTDDIINFEIPENNTGAERKYVVIIDTNGLKTQFTITQPMVDSPNSRFAEIRTPQWQINNEDSEWTGCRAFKVNSEFENFFLKCTNYDNWYVKEVIIDDEPQKVNINPIGNAVYHELQSDSSMLIKILTNHTSYERVIVVIMACKNEFLDYEEYTALTFVQAPQGGRWE